jgi:hypothetical protein
LPPTAPTGAMASGTRTGLLRPVRHGPARDMPAATAAAGRAGPQGEQCDTGATGDTGPRARRDRKGRRATSATSRRWATRARPALRNRPPRSASSRACTATSRRSPAARPTRRRRAAPRVDRDGRRVGHHARGGPTVPVSDRTDSGAGWTVQVDNSQAGAAATVRAVACCRSPPSESAGHRWDNRKEAASRSARHGRRAQRGSGSPLAGAPRLSCARCRDASAGAVVRWRQTDAKRRSARRRRTTSRSRVR